jgi:hypothetical protein
MGEEMPSKKWAVVVILMFLSVPVTVSGDISPPLPSIAPIADIGPDQTISEGQTVTIDASNSSDSDGDITLYEFDFGDGTNYDFVPSPIPNTTILIYATCDEPFDNYLKDAFDEDLVDILTNHGYTVTITDRLLTPLLTSVNLFQYGQLWIISSDFDTQGDFTTAEVDLILDFARSGRGLFVISDHGSGTYESFHDANQISVPLGLRFYGLFNHGPNGLPIAPNFVPHPVTAGLTEICAHDSAAGLNVSAPMEITVVATYNLEPMIAVREDAARRVVFDNTIVRFMNVGQEMPRDWVMVADTPQYVRNVADFLSSSGYEKPPLIKHRYGDDGRGTDGIYTVTLTATDDSMEMSQDQMVVTVANTPPQVSTVQDVVTFRNIPVSLSAQASDNGSDDLTFTWEFGDGTIPQQLIFYNNGVNPDPYPSPGPVFPFTRLDTRIHSFKDLGTYVVNLTVMDDDGGLTLAQIKVQVVPFHPARNLTTRAEGSDVVLNWLPSPSVGVDQYLIFSGDTPISLDLSTPLAVVSGIDLEWRDFGVSSTTGEKYYSVRAYNVTYSLKSRTSNTAGKFTKWFDAGLSSFSLPLEPFGDRMVSDYADDIPNAEYVRWLDANGNWVTHDKDMLRGEMDAFVEMGKGYEVLLSRETDFTFCGQPGGMINYTEWLGGDPAYTSSLNVQLIGSDVELSWSSTLGAVGFFVFKSSTRGGLLEPSLLPIAYTSTTTWTDSDVISVEGESYYFVMPVDEFGELGSSSYSVGVQTIAYEDGSDTFSLPLNTSLQMTLDDLCDDIPGVVGMAYMVFEIWRFHAIEMPHGIYDVDVPLGDGFQLSIESPSPVLWTFVGY